MRRSKKKDEPTVPPRPNWHDLDPWLASAPCWGVIVVGAGGNGCQMIAGLAQMHRAMIELGHPGGLSVTVYDDDLVSESNIGRQLYSPADVGLNKAIVAVNRVNLFYGLDWDAVPERFPKTEVLDYHCRPRRAGRFDLLISCVDTVAARQKIHRAMWKNHSSPTYWLDMGNGKHDGQVILGQPAKPSGPIPKQRLPCVTELFPEMLAPDFPEDDTPSCSLAEALTHQDLFINRAVSTFALELLWSLFRNGGLSYHGAFINLESGHVNPLRVGGSLK
jgi:PRTRC genetic system ThiF family protein